MKHTKVLVTGATGFLGKNVCKKILENNTLDVCMTSLRGDKNQNVRALNVMDFAAVSKFVHEVNPDIVYHLGGLVDLTRDYTVAIQCIEANLIGTANLLEALKGHSVRQFIYTSTEEVYGKGKLPYKEDCVLYPPSPYAVSKLAGEYMCHVYAQMHEFSVVVFRIGTMYGPYQPNNRYIFQVINKALNNEEIPLNSGLKKRDYVYVGDIVEALLSALNKKLDNEFEIINLGGGINMTLIALVEKIISACGSTSALRIGVIPDRISEADEWLLDNTKAKVLLGWNPKTDIQKGLHQTIDFYKSQ